MEMNSSSQRNHLQIWAPSLFLFFSLIIFSRTPVSCSTSDQYSAHCSKIVPESPPTVSDTTTTFSFIQTVLGHYTGGDGLLGQNRPSPGSQKSVTFEPNLSILKTKTSGIYKIKAFLSFQSLNSTFFRTQNRRRNSVRFKLHGFWSEFTGDLCMVGSAPRYSNQGDPVNLDAVLKLRYPKNPTILTSLITGTLESLSSSTDLNYFQPVSFWAFGSSSRYNYTLVSGQFDSNCSGGGIEIPQDQSLGLEPDSFCSSLWGRFNYFELEYMNDCKSLKTCTPVDQSIGYLPQVMSLYSIHCSEEEHKVQYTVGFGNNSYYDEARDPSTTLVAEGSWDEKKNRMCIVACRILNSTDGVHVGDCSIRMSLRYPSFWSIQERSSVVGQIWTNKTVNEPGYFNRITFRGNGNSFVGGVSPLSGLRYQYTQIERVRKLCPITRPVETKGENKYPKANSYDMRFDMSFKDSKGKQGWGYADPLFVGNRSFQSEVDAGRSYNGSLLKISYTISITNPVIQTPGYLSNVSFFSNRREEISAEGIYDGEIGKLCMVGCRKHLSTDDGSQMDCKLILKFEFPPTNAKNRAFIKGTIESTRKNTDPLYFEQLKTSSMAFYTEQARNSLWRIDLEIAMVLISNTLACVFVVLQIFHLRNNPQLLPFVSILMLVILTLGYMVPLVLNFEAFFSRNRNRQSVMLESSSGWLEVNEVIVRVVTMVAFLLQFRLLQLVWSARLGSENQKGSWVAEKKAFFVSSPLYILGALVLILVHTMSQQNSLLGALKSYSGLVLDFFLLPQILLNIFRVVSGENKNALSLSFYIGTTCVRLLPHAYDLYRGQNYASSQFDGSLIYADPSVDFYSRAWDVTISCGGVMLAVVIYLQQRFGGRCVLPRKFREVEGYEKVAESELL